MNILEQENQRNPEEFYASLKEKLKEHHNFPEHYLFKFILPTNPEKLTEIYRIFDGLDHSTNTRDSKGGKYISLSINAFVLDADQVINLYQKVGKIDGVLML